MKIRVLQFFGSFNQGGSERQAAALTKMLVHDGRFDVSVAALEGSGILRRRVEALRIGEIAEFPLTSFYDPNFIRQLWRCVAFLKENEISVVHTHDFYTNVFGMAAASLAKVPVKIASKRETGGMRTAAQEFVEKGAFKRADKVIANSESVRDHLINDYAVGSDRIDVIYNGIDVSRFSRDHDRGFLRTSVGVSQEERLVTIVANLRHTVKNIPMFLRAASSIAEEFRDVRFMVAGEGELRGELMALASSLGIASRVNFIGRCDDVPALLAASEVCVLTSTNEGFSNSILEYMAAGRPVVATDAGGASEAVVEGKTGFLVPSDDDRALADKLAQLLNDPDLARSLGDNGRKRVIENFSAEMQLAMTVGLYERLLSEKGR